MTRPIALAVLLLSVGGCTNSIYFYETEKVSLTVEGRPDSSQPISASLGIKQRVAAVVPPRVEGNDPNTDAMSMISYFDFKKENEGLFNDPITIRTALITGRAGEIINTEAATDLIAGFVSVDARIDALYSIDPYIDAYGNGDASLKALFDASAQGLSAGSYADFEDLVANPSPESVAEFVQALRLAGYTPPAAGG